MKKYPGKLRKSNNVESRRRAVEALRENKDASIIPDLIEAMKDESWRVRKTATEILKDRFQIKQYIEGIISLLYADDNAGARNSAIDLLVSTGRTAVPYLIKAFDTVNNDVRKFIIDVIGEISDKRAIPLLLNALKDENENVKASAVEHLGELREPSVVDALIDILKGNDLWLAYPTVDALGRICDKKALPHLVNALKTRTLREPALRALACFSEPDTLDSIVPLLVEGSRSVREEVLRTLNNFYKNGIGEDIIAGKIRKYLGDDALDILLKFAWSNKLDIRLSAILLLGMLKDVRVVQPLLDMSSEEDFRDVIKRALVFIGSDMPDYIIELVDHLNIIQKRFMTEVAVGINRKEFSGMFERLLHDEDGHVRTLAIRGFAGLGDESTADMILPLLNDEYEDVQEETVRTLTRLKGGLDIDSLLNNLSDNNAFVRRNSAIVLGRIRASGVVPSIGFLVKDPDVSVRTGAVVALSMINDPDCIKHLMIALTDEIPGIRIAAARALGGMGTNESTDALIMLLSDPDDAVRVAAAKALGKQAGEKAFRPLEKLLSDDNGFVVIAAIEAIGKMRTKSAKNAIVSMLNSDDDEIRRTAVSSLSNFEGVREILLPFLRDPDWATRKIVVKVLGKKRDISVVNMLEEIFDEESDPSVKETIKEVLNAD